MTLMRVEGAANRQSYFIAPGGGFLHQTAMLGRVRKALAKRETWEMGDYSNSKHHNNES